MPRTGKADRNEMTRFFRVSSRRESSEVTLCIVTPKPHKIDRMPRFTLQTLRDLGQSVEMYLIHERRISIAFGRGKRKVQALSIGRQRPQSCS